MDRVEKAILCTLHSIKGVGNRSLWRIKEEFGSFLSFFQADSKKLYSSFLSSEIAEDIISVRSKINCLRYLEEMEQKGILSVDVEDDNYPQLLRNITNPPYIIYYRGRIESCQDTCLAIVGSRMSTPYGESIARSLSRELAERGIGVVSGMARGIDTEAHGGALDMGGNTIAVLGSGLNVIYPRSNSKLYHRIIEQGAVISEFSLDIQPEAGNFPMRNRIISGLCRGVIVVEAKARSGALITADFALEQGRDVFAVPGPINKTNSEGTNNLIKQGAKLVTGIEDIIEEYYDIKIPSFAKLPEQTELLFLDENENRIVQCLNDNPLHFDHLIARSSLEIGLLSTLLLKLELAGIVKSLPGNYYERV